MKTLSSIIVLIGFLFAAHAQTTIQQFDKETVSLRVNKEVKDGYDNYTILLKSKNGDEYEPIFGSNDRLRIEDALCNEEHTECSIIYHQDWFVVWGRFSYLPELVSWSKINTGKIIGHPESAPSEKVRRPVSYRIERLNVLELGYRDKSIDYLYVSTANIPISYVTFRSLDEIPEE